MSDAAIRVEGIGKEYRIGERAQAYHTLRDTLAGVTALPKRLFKPRPRLERDETHFWALRDVSFEVRHGDVVGVIGHNGSGKSTLLKILSRITEPTEGFARIQGRVGSLLEVGTGFHPELTGRENTYLNGAILGMKRAEVQRKFDEIVAFSGVEKFIDTPVKHYSSGMYLRLAFAVAAHLDPEILVVDEVLAVGDAMFQKKCVAKMREVARQGRTVVLVSHNLALVKDFCNSGILLRHGKVLEHGSMLDCVAKYSRQLSDVQEAHTFNGSCWTDVRLRLRDPNAAERHENIIAEATLVLKGVMRSARVFCNIDSSSGESVAQSAVNIREGQPALFTAVQRVTIDIPALWLAPDAYSLYFKFVGVTEAGHNAKFVSEMHLLNIVDGSQEHLGKLRARLVPDSNWRIQAIDR